LAQKNAGLATFITSQARLEEEERVYRIADINARVSFSVGLLSLNDTLARLEEEERVYRIAVINARVSFSVGP
jgi:hypothetical protein